MIKRYAYIVALLTVTSAFSFRAEGSEHEAFPSIDIEMGEKEDAYEKIELLTEILMQIKRNYVDEKEYTEIINGAIHGMLLSLDPHSDYLEPENYKEMKEDTRGTYGGVGIHIGIRNDVLTVIAPIEDTPAFEAGMLAGDRIVEIDGVKTRGIKLSDAVEKIRGRKKTTVVLTVLREGEGEVLDFEVQRADIEVSSVKGARIIRNDIGYIRITQFSVPTAESLQESLDELLDEDMKGLVLDLRNNPGGLVRSAVQVAQKFLEKGELIVSTRGRRGKEGGMKKNAGGRVRYLDMPLVILVNKGSASASEIVAGALQDQNRAVLLGETTYGKGSVQSILPLRSERDSAIRLTTARYYTPSGRVIHDHGVEPDILVYVPPVEWLKVQRRRALLENRGLYTDEDLQKYSEVRDRQLERAVDLVEAMMIYDGLARGDAEE